MPINLKNVRREVEGGLSSSYQRRWEAKQSHDFFNLDFERYPVRAPESRYDYTMPPRYSPFMNRVVGILGGYLYKTQPTRKLGTPEGSEWLNRVYKASKVWAKWKHADELTCIGGISAFQFSGSPDPQAPVKVTQWCPHELEVFVDPDEPTKVGAVATIDAFDTGQRLRCYTEDVIMEFEKEKGVQHEAMGSASWRYKSEKKNPYRTLPDEENPKGKGLIPFSFAHWFYPTSEFTTASPGPVLRKLNENFSIELTLIGDSIPLQAFPIGIATGVDAGWRPPLKVKPGDWLPLAASDVDAAGNGPVPSLQYLVQDLQYLSAIWEDINNLLDHELELFNIPPAMIRMIQTAARSGLSIQAEQLPLVSWVEGRRPAWADYEEEAARMALLMGWNHNMVAGHQDEANRLRRDLEDWRFMLRWPSLFSMLPGPERNAESDWRLQRGFVSKVGLIIEQSDATEEEAYELLAKVEEQNRRIEAMGIDPGAEPTATQFPGQYSGFGGGAGEPNGEEQPVATNGQPVE